MLSALPDDTNSRIKLEICMGKQTKAKKFKKLTIMDCYGLINIHVNLEIFKTFIWLWELNHI